MVIGVSLSLTLFRGRRNLKVTIEDTPGAWGTVLLRLLAHGWALSRRDWLLSRRQRGRCHVCAAPPSFAYSPEEHPERLAWNTSDGWRLDSGVGLESIQVRCVVWRLEVNALHLCRCLPGHLGCHGWPRSGSTGWRLQILENPRIWSQGALLGKLDGTQSGFLWWVQTSQGGDLSRSLAWCLDAAYEVLDQTSRWDALRARWISGHQS